MVARGRAGMFIFLGWNTMGAPMKDNTLPHPA
jgi:hypothetical protein